MNMMMQDFMQRRRKKLGVPQGSTLLGVFSHADNELENAKAYWLDVKASCPIANKNYITFFKIQLNKVNRHVLA
jgi:hypothetical protein